jgi:hypothetical protein
MLGALNGMFRTFGIENAIANILSEIALDVPLHSREFNSRSICARMGR